MVEGLREKPSHGHAGPPDWGQRLVHSGHEKDPRSWVRPVDRLADIPPDILGIHRSRRTARIFAAC